MASQVVTMVGSLDAGETDWGDEDSQLAKAREQPEAGDNIRVAVRVRPPNSRELAGEGGGVCVDIDEGAGTVASEGAPPFSFDLAFSMECTQLEIFEKIGIDIVSCAFHGYNASLFAYGQTSSGKSFSMMGVRGTSLVGLIPRIIRLLFSVVDGAEDREVLIETGYLEIYNEKIRDLLGDGSGGELRLREHPALGVHVAGLTKVAVASEDETLDTIEEGTRQRTTAATLFNTESSRSHSVFEVNVQSKYTTGGVEMRSTSRLSLIDLAGSERSSKLGSTGKALQEGNNINKSLTVLGRCIRALVETSQGKSKAKAPFRDSVLTYYLRDSLSGNAKTTMLAACSPVFSNQGETMSTLRYAASAKNIKTSAKKNEDQKQAKIQELTDEIERLRQRLLAAETSSETSGSGALGSLMSSVSDISRRASGAAASGEGDDRERMFSLESTTDISKEVAEMEHQMKLMTEGYEVSKKLGRSTLLSRKSKMSFSDMDIPASQFPLLTCLNKDELLSHVMTMPLSTLPFTIGRASSEDFKPTFALTGMGIAGRHCSIEHVSYSADPNDVVIKLLSDEAELAVNGEHFQGSDETGEDGVKLNHMDRIVIGPCRLICLFLTKPLTREERQQWTYDSISAELSRLTAGLTRSLMSPARKRVVETQAMVQSEQVAQANTIAVEMGVPVRFVCHTVIRGSEGFHLPDITLDEFLEANEPTLMVSCMVNPNRPPINSAVDMANNASLFHKSKASAGPRALNQRAPPKASFAQRPAKPVRKASWGIGSRQSRDSKQAISEEAEEEPPAATVPASKPTPLRRGSVAAGTAEESLFEVTLEDFDEIITSLKLSHNGLTALTGDLNSGGGGSSGLSAAEQSALASNEVAREMHKIKAVFTAIDTDQGGTIDREELARGIMAFNLPGDRADVLDMLYAELFDEELTASAELDYAAFEMFLIKFLQHQFYRCVEGFVTNRGLFSKLGGRDIHGLAMAKFSAKAKAKTTELQEEGLLGGLTAGVASVFNFGF